MNTKPPIAVKPEVNPVTVRPHDQKVSHAATKTGTEPHAPETIETINARATSVTIVLQKIMTYEGGYHHGGLND